MVGYYQRFDDGTGVKEIFLGAINSLDFSEALKLARSNIEKGKVKSKYYCIIEKSEWSGEKLVYDNRPKENALEKTLKNN